MLRHPSPAGAATTSRKGIWQIDDHYLRAWFRFVRGNRTDLENRREDDVFRDRIKPVLDHFVSKPAFEDAARQHVSRAIGRDRDFPRTGAVGAWWGPVPDEAHPGTRRTREGEIEIVAYDGYRLTLAAEAKWSNGPEGGAALRTCPGTWCRTGSSGGSEAERRHQPLSRSAVHHEPIERRHPGRPKTRTLRVSTVSPETSAVVAMSCP